MSWWGSKSADHFGSKMYLAHKTRASVDPAPTFCSARPQHYMREALACALAHVAAQSMAHCGVGQESLPKSALDSAA